MKNLQAISERVVMYAHKTIDELYQELNLPANGYDKEQVKQSQNLYGKNVLNVKQDTVYYRLRCAFINPFMMILLVMAIISFITDVMLASNFSRNITTMLIILSMMMIGGTIRFIQEMHSKKVLAHLSKLTSVTAMVYRKNKWQEILIEDLAVGDKIRLSAGDFAPADLRLTATLELFVSQSAITGESAILEKNTATMPKNFGRTYTQYQNIVFMGSSIISGSGEGIVLAVGEDTAYGGISQAVKLRKSGFKRGANSIAWVLIHFMMVLIPLVFIACGLTKGDWLASFLFALSVAVGLTPEMLPMVINACLARSSIAMERKQTIVKDINSMQELGNMDILCVDKTGTLTGDTLLLEYYMDILGNESSKTLDFAYLNSFYYTGVHNPLDSAILHCYTMPGRQQYFDELVKSYIKLDEIPFDYERKFVSTLVQGTKENLLLLKGSVDEVCKRCNYVEYRGKQSDIKQYSNDYLQNVHAIVDEMLEDGMKVLAIAYKPMQAKTVCDFADEYNCILLGYIAFLDAPKQSAKTALAKLNKLHVNVRVLTGDVKSVACSICHRLNLPTSQILTGTELSNLTKDEIPMRIEQTNIFAELSPKQKAYIVEVLKQNGHTVGFLGDGMNDLPAIVSADVGISVDNAVETVQENADVILLKKDLVVLTRGILEGRKAFTNMTKYIKITASSNFGNILSIVIASVFLPFLPMTAIQLLLLNLLYDTLCLVLPWDNIDEDMYKFPREWSGKTLGQFMRFFGPISSVFDILTFLFLYFGLCPAICGGSFSELTPQLQLKFIAIFQTGWFLESMWSQILILYLLRTQKLPFVQSRPSLPVITITCLGIALFTTLTFTPLGNLLGLVALPPHYFLFLNSIVLAYMLVVTIAKTYYVRKYRELI